MVHLYVSYLKIMERLKELGTWMLIVIAFYLFSNGLIYICLHNGSITNNNMNNSQTVNQVKSK